MDATGSGLGRYSGVGRSDELCLLRGSEVIQTFPLETRAVEVGSSADCDISVHDPAVAHRAFLVVPRGGTLHVYDLVASPGLSCRSTMALGRELRLGAGYMLARRKRPEGAAAPLRTERLRRGLLGAARPIALVTGRGQSARAFPLLDAPLSIGASSHNGLALPDRAVSRFHCRIEPAADAVVVRDLGSTNGTWVDGNRVQRLPLRAGAIVRVGRTELLVTGSSPSEAGPNGVLVARSPSVIALMAEVDRIASVPWPALVRGETGVGKELVARALHQRGPRRKAPFVALNAGGLPRELIESELFGHERGAFTGAIQSHRGAFEQADGGTLFLDEVAELPAALQTRMLRVLETWRVRRVGSETSRSVDVRLVCATHRDLRRMVHQGDFRADLYYRIHRLVIDIPPLRRRLEDVAPLAEHFLTGIAAHLGEKRLTTESLARLRTHAWPGNVRELRNTLELASIHADGANVEVEHVERALRRLCNSAVQVDTGVLREVLEAHRGNLSATARALGLPRSTLRDRLRAASLATDGR